MSVGLEDYHLIAVWDWKKGRVVATVRGHSDRVSSLSSVNYFKQSTQQGHCYFTIFILLNLYRQQILLWLFGLTCLFVSFDCCIN